MTNKLLELNKRDNDCPHNLILDHIPSGSENAVSMKYLANILGTDERQIRHMIESARVYGFIIAGTNDGIFIPETSEELDEYTSRTYARIETSVNTLRPALALTGRQITFGLEGRTHDQG